MNSLSIRSISIPKALALSERRDFMGGDFRGSCKDNQVAYVMQVAPVN